MTTPRIAGWLVAGISILSLATGFSVVSVASAESPKKDRIVVGFGLYQFGYWDSIENRCDVLTRARLQSLPSDVPKCSRRLRRLVDNGWLTMSFSSPDAQTTF